MRRTTTALLGALLAASLAACSTTGSSAEEDRTTTTKRSAPTTEPSPGSTTTTEAEAAEEQPWSAVVAAAQVKAGRLRQTTGSRLVSTGEVVEDGTIIEVVDFDQERLVAQRTLTLPSAADEQIPGPLEFFYSQDGTFLSAPWVEEKCGAPWVSVDASMEESGLGVAFGVEDLFPPDPLGPLVEVAPPESPGEVSDEGTTYQVELSAALVPASSYLAREPDVAERLMAQTQAATVTVGAGGRLTVEMELPMTVMADAGSSIVEGLEPEALAEVAIWTRWVLREPVPSVDLTVPTDVAADPACAD